ncbi:unnamed protein product [Lactuca saligna]|uniref:Uncharacterized protein n=1 Tax=Lactuca saligna TaxID=75948 RepID=A0AA35YFV7_LACSI|nr:unnamed protein product [Lactuca saligna]
MNTTLVDVAPLHTDKPPGASLSVPPVPPSTRLTTIISESFSRGLDDDVLVTFPTFLIPHKSATDSCDTDIDVTHLGCSICLADYKSTDVVRQGRLN